MPFTSKSASGSLRVHVRAVIALIFVLGLSWGFFNGLIQPSEYKDIAMIAIVWYFTKRQSDSDAGNNAVE